MSHMLDASAVIFGDSVCCALIVWCECVFFCVCVLRNNRRAAGAQNGVIAGRRQGHADPSSDIHKDACVVRFIRCGEIPFNARFQPVIAH